eukprot:m.211576 g.211576  ORF g.211576 m.211576 type:complete len:204 (+) comp15840_c0_seq1:2532-3143(+)
MAEPLGNRIKNAWVEPDDHDDFTAADEDLPSLPNSPSPDFSEQPEFIEPPQQPQVSPPQHEISPYKQQPQQVPQQQQLLQKPQPPPQPKLQESDTQDEGVKEDTTQYGALNLWNRIQQHLFALEMKTKRRWLKKYNQCITGKELVTIVLKFLKENGRPTSTREQATKICERFSNLGNLTVVHARESNFVDSSSRFYRVISSNI